MIALSKRQSVGDAEICNQVTGQVIRFLQTSADTNGELLEMESVYSPFSDEPPVHYHPAQRECFTILYGELAVRLNNKIHVYSTGDVIEIERGTRHSMWNPGQAETLVNWKVMPAANTEAFLKAMTALANTGHTNDKGVPALPLMIYLLKKYERIFRIAKPPIGIINAFYLILKPVFILRDYKGRLNI